MKNMSKCDIEKSINASIDILTSKNLSPIKEMRIEEKKMKSKKNNNHVLLPACILIIFAVVFGISYYNANIKVTSKVSFDVNPSIVLSMNKNNKVVDFEALNDDGSKILEELDIYGVDAESATNVIVSELISQGYLSGDGANILLTIQNNDLELAKDMESKLTVLINDELEKEYIAGTVLTQVDTVRVDIKSDIKDLMSTYEISYSKAIFLSNLLRKDSTLNISELAKYSISEISRVVHNKHISLEDIVNYDNSKSLYDDSSTEGLRKNQDQSSKLAERITDEASSIKAKLDEASKKNEDISSIKEQYSKIEKDKNSATKNANEAKNEYQKAKNK